MRELDPRPVPRIMAASLIEPIIVATLVPSRNENHQGASSVASDGQSPFRSRLLAAVSVVALIGWGVAGYLFWSASNARDEAAARLMQAETARQDVAHKLDEQVKAAGMFADLQAKIAGAEKELDATT